MNFRFTLTALAFAFAASPRWPPIAAVPCAFPPGSGAPSSRARLAGWKAATIQSCDHTLSARKGQTLRAALNRSSLDLIAVEPVERDFPRATRWCWIGTGR